MKRTVVDDAGHPPKRHKSESRESSPDLFEPTLRRTARDVCLNGTDGSGYLSGIAFMVWPIGSHCRVMMQVEDHGRVDRFEVKLSGRCRKYFGKLDFVTQDHFEISLKGAELKKKQESSRPCDLPMTLTFNEGVVVKFTKRPRKPAEDGLVINTWKLEEADRMREEAAKLDEIDGRSFWFATPVNPPSDRLLSNLSMDVDKPESLDKPESPVVERPENTSSVAPVVRDRSPPPTPAVVKPEGRVQQSVRPAVPKISSHAVPTPNGAAKTHETLVQRPQAHPSRVQDIFDSESTKATAMSSADAKPAPGAPPPTSNSINLPSPHVSTSSNQLEGHGNSSASTVQAQLPPPPKLTKKQQRLLRKAQRVVANAASASLDSQTVSVPSGPAQVIPDPSLRKAQKVAANEASTSLDSQSVSVPSGPPQATLDPTTSIPANISSTSNENTTESRDPSLDLHAGFWTETGDKYTPLNDVIASSGLCNVAGVVTSIRPTERTRANDLYCSLTLVDSSNINVDNVIGSIEGLGTTINCFTAKYAAWLPSPKVGDVLILRGVKVGGTTLVGYKDRLRWAMFDPDAGKLHHGDRGDAPESEGLADGFGYEFCPFWKAKEAELTHCLRLADWWLAALKKVQSNMGHVHQIGSGVSYSSGAKARRIHRLISEASPDLPPNGFFDCTVEIIKGFLNDNDVYSLYVTDYTINPKTTPVQASWCPPALADLIFKVEMWDSASQLAQTMEPGEYWFLRNARMKVSGAGYMEGTMQLAEKVQKLDENAPTRDPHLQALLERKREWEKVDQSVDGPFDHQLIKDVNKSQFFDCTVEILHSDFNPNGLSYIYVTDYTRHPDLPVVPTTNAWAHGLEKCIVKVILWDEQMAMAKTVEPGCYYTIRKLRLMQSTTGSQFQGRLGGAERLIHRLKSVDSSNVRLAALLQSKAAWELSQKEDGQDLESKEQEADVARSEASRPYPLPGFNSISEILASRKCRNKFRLVARIKNFYPMHLEECVVLRCMKCLEILPATRKECIKCSDMVDSHVKCLYCFLFLLEDEEGNNILISISDEKCSLLRGLKPADLREDPDSLAEFTERLRPIIGNLLEVHHSAERGEIFSSETPMLKLIIDSWKNSDSISYGLMDLEVISDS